MTADSEGAAVSAGVCPKCGKPSASPPAEVFCVDCATEGWEKDATAHRAVSADDGPEIVVNGITVGRGEQGMAAALHRMMEGER